MQEARFAMLTRTSPERAEQLMEEAQRDVDERWKYYEQLAGVDRTAPSLPDFRATAASNGDLAGEGDA